MGCSYWDQREDHTASKMPHAKIESISGSALQLLSLVQRINLTPDLCINWWRHGQQQQEGEKMRMLHSWCWCSDGFGKTQRSNRVRLTLVTRRRRRRKEKKKRKRETPCKSDQKDIDIACNGNLSTMTACGNRSSKRKKEEGGSKRKKREEKKRPQQKKDTFTQVDGCWFGYGLNAIWELSHQQRRNQVTSMRINQG